MSGEVSLGESVVVGSGAVVREGCPVGNGSLVGAGAVVLTDLPAGSTAVVVPAKVIDRSP